MTLTGLYDLKIKFQIEKAKTINFLENYVLSAGLLLAFCLYLVANDKNEMQTSFYLLILLPSLFLFTKYYHLILKNLYFFPVLLFLFYSFASLFWSVGYDLDDAIDMLKTIIYLLIFSMAIGITFKQQPFLKILNILSLIAAGSSLYSLYHFYFMQQFEFGSRMPGWGNLYHALRAGTVYGYFALIVALGFIYTQYNSKIKVAFFLLLLAILCLGLLHTVSRTPLAAFFITAILAIFFEVDRYQKLFLVSLTSSTIITIFIFPDAIAYLMERGAHGRFEIWSQALGEIKKAPIFGHGIISEPTIYFNNILFESAHNRLLSTIYYTGVIGGLLLTIILVTAFWPMRTKASLSAQYAKYMLLYACLCSLTEGKYLISRPDMVWLIFWLPLSVLLMEKYYQHQTKQNSTAK